MAIEYPNVPELSKAHALAAARRRFFLTLLVVCCGRNCPLQRTCTMMSHDFVPLSLSSATRVELEFESCRFVVRAWNNSRLELEPDATHFGFVQNEHANLSGPHKHFSLATGMYFTQPDAGLVYGTGHGLVVSQFGYRGFFHVGGPVESRGRLRYIDGCSDSLLISPIVQGEACLNFLHFPPHTAQTPHTHPSFRVGLIHRGRGVCRTTEATTPLFAGMAFVIPADGLHSFHTDESSLDVIAFHPDSDFGPTHDDHPMINRTIISGATASRSSAISSTDTSLALPYSRSGDPSEMS